MDKMLIAPIKSGLQTDLVPFMMPEDAFQILQNVFIYDGTVRRRPAMRLTNNTNANGMSSRLRINIGTTNAVTGNLPATVVPGTATIIGVQFSVDGTLFTVYQANGAMYASPDVPVGVNGTFNVATMTVVINGATPATTVYYYPTQPVIGITNFSETTGNNLEIAFDLQFSYQYTVTGWERIIGGAGLFLSLVTDRISSDQYFGSVAGQNALFVTNNTDNVRYYTDALPTFTNFTPDFIDPAVTPNTNLITCKYIVGGFQNRLLLLNTRENINNGGAPLAVRYKNRIRYSEYGAAFNADSWYQPPGTVNKGGFVDLPAGKEIVCAEILDSRLIIFCIDSIFELVPTNNKREPFNLALVDDTHGSKSPNVVEVNNSLLFANNFGLYIYDGRNIKKLNYILDDTFDNQEYRYGQIYKDSANEIVYILISAPVGNAVPNKMLIYNYKNNTFSLFYDLCTRMGDIYHNQTGARFNRKATIFGNHRGYIHLGIDNLYKNRQSQNIINIDRIDAQNIELTIPDHNLADVDYIRVEDSALVGLNDSYGLTGIIDANNISVFNVDPTVIRANYNGDATMSRIDRIDIQTKQFNPYMKQGVGTSVNKVAFNVNKTTTNGVLQVYGLPNDSSAEELVEPFLGEGLLNTAAYALKPREAQQPRIWHHVYFQTSGESVAMRIYFHPDQLIDPDEPYQEVTINAIMLYTEPALYI